MAHGKTIERGHLVRDSYLEWIRKFPLRPIRSDKELDAAISVVDSLIDKPKLDSGESDYLEVLGDLISKYESDNHSLGNPSDADLMAHLLEVRAATQAETSRRTGIATSTLSAVLAGKRKLTRGQIEKLAKAFKVAPATFYSS